MTAAKKARGHDTSDLSFEAALEQLEAIVQHVEEGEIGLEQSLAEYERGMTLIQRCKEILARAEQRVEELSRAQLEGMPRAAADKPDAD